MVNSEVSNNPRGKNSLTAVRGGDRTRTIAIQIAVAAVLIALIAAIGISIAVKQHKKNDNAGATPTVGSSQASPSGLTGSITDKGAIRIGKPGAKSTLNVVADLQCPSCKMFESANGQAITNAVNSGTTTVEYNIIAFLDQSSQGTRYSSRAANAAYCVAGSDPGKFLPWLISMYDQQPEEGSQGLPDGKLVQIAQSAGYTDPAVAQCITSDKFASFVQKTTQQVLSSGVNSTPTVTLNGKQITGQELMTPNGLQPALEAAGK
ncbi:MAG: thioredoxin domain-containing protein [Nocardia sp.]|nr:thioredoxin domain-containing protein [Nocardia sp.]